ncbi:MAG: tRNA pseudouridine(13) synthase TruD [Gammaproteobacteria bacterium]|nr:tRNA pseudouridine(13) synthase TruD [Gammaproteobacteria bacterium]MBT8109941.1 tRNA pseudouridine(13) synthase TruD [Gammaproteobacteria bacterium]NND47571.1 tRNA pseudouridine(13) synthase TruD [Woeseiaceae bacterium]NNL44643.1 tRNA pseudouridine(13) synthase TruD [Woeseiaceae bacterium]
MSLPDWTRAHGVPLFSASIRTTADEFDVSEELGFDFSADGEHDYLYLEKVAANTEWVSRQLALHADVPARDVGYAGLKDRHAVTRQWFSVPRWNAADWDRLDVEGVRVLDQQRHNRKLRRGAHQANRFRIVLRGVLPDAGALNERLETIKALGVPNYFGEQRFGRGGSNIALADAWSQGKRLPRHKRSIAISTARSYIFNEILDARVCDQTWNRLVADDFANLDGSGSVFSVDQPDDELTQRCNAMDIHPTGPMCGDGTSPSVVPAGHDSWLKALKNARVKPAHRSLRLRVVGLEWSTGADSLVLCFALGRGAFATSVLREIATIADAAR